MSTEMMTESTNDVFVGSQETIESDSTSEDTLESDDIESTDQSEDESVTESHRENQPEEAVNPS